MGICQTCQLTFQYLPSFGKKLIIIKWMAQQYGYLLPLDLWGLENQSLFCKCSISNNWTSAFYVIIPKWWLGNQYFCSDITLRHVNHWTCFSFLWYMRIDFCRWHCHLNNALGCVDIKWVVYSSWNMVWENLCIYRKKSKYNTSFTSKLFTLVKRIHRCFYLPSQIVMSYSSFFFLI